MRSKPVQKSGARSDKIVATVRLVGIAALACACASCLTAGSADDTELKQVIVFGRHSVRAPQLPNSALNVWSAQPFPDFGVEAGGLTAQGAADEVLLGAYYRLWLIEERLLSGEASADAARVYFRSAQLERHVDTARSFWAGLLPGAPAKVVFLSPPTAIDPLFQPVEAGIARLDPAMAAAAVNGRLGNLPQSLAGAYAAELALTRSVLFGYPDGEIPVPGIPNGKTDVTASPFTVSAGTASAPLVIGGLTDVTSAIDPFVMEYADGLAESQLGWGSLTPERISQIARLTTLKEDLRYRTPSLDRAQSSNLASHIVRSLVQAASGSPMRGALGSPSDRVIVVIASDTDITGFAGLFDLHWAVSGYPLDFCAPGGALVLELRQSRGSGEHFLRASYVTQTLDQLRQSTLLTLDSPPVRAPLFIPGCSTGNANYDCLLEAFVALARRAIDRQSVDTEHSFKW